MYNQIPRIYKPKGYKYHQLTSEAYKSRFSLFSVAITHQFTPVPKEWALCISDCPGAHYLEQVGLELTESCLPLSREWWD